MFTTIAEFIHTLTSPLRSLPDGVAMTLVLLLGTVVTFAFYAISVLWENRKKKRELSNVVRTMGDDADFFDKVTHYRNTL